LTFARPVGSAFERDRAKNARIVRLEMERSRVAAQCSGKLRAAALEHLGDTPLGALVAEPGRECDAVTIECGAAIARSDETIVFAIFALYEAVARRMDANSSRDGAVRCWLFLERRARRERRCCRLPADQPIARALRLFDGAALHQLGEQRAETMFEFRIVAEL